MRVFIVRHGKAEPDSRTGGDEDRALAPRGRLQAAYLGHAIGAEDRRPKRVLVSGLKRARQTAEVISESLRADLVHEPALETGHNASEIVSLLQRQDAGACLMLVGHNPQLGDLIGLLLQGPEAGGCILRTGEAVVIDVRLSQPIGTGRLVERIRLDEAAMAGARP
jgi:phosphohistidine phosphatase